MSARVILLTGPSGSGKTRLLRDTGAHRLRLDDFYRDGDEPHMPLLGGGDTGEAGVSNEEAAGVVDWDHPGTWDADRAMDAVLELCRTGRTRVPVYSIPLNATVDHEELCIGEAPAFVAEGIFAAELVDRCREAGVLADAIVLARPRVQTWWFRLRRDLTDRRKPVVVLITRGLRLARQEPDRIRGWVAQGCRPLGRAACVDAIRTHLR